MRRDNADRAKPQAARRLRLASSYLVAGACLAWVFCHIHPRAFLESVRQLKWPVVALAIAFDNANYASQGIRWSLLLRPLAPVRSLKAIQATYVGVFTSNVLPMRFGEIVRAYLVSSWTSKKFAEIIPSMVLEHLFEGIWLTLLLGAAAFLLPLPAALEKAVKVFGAGVALLAATCFYFLLQEKRGRGAAERKSPKLMHKVEFFLKELTIGIQRIGLSPRFFVGLAATLASLAFQALALWAVAVACGIELPLWGAAVVLAIIRVGVTIPNAPANLGAYQFFAALGMELLGVGRSAANGFALILFFVLMIPTWITGFLSLYQSGTTLIRLQREARDAAGPD